MKNLLLMRHAKSSWKDETLKDYERHLKKRGFKDTKLIAKEIKKNHLTPDLILASTAQRVKETVEVFVETIDYKHELVYSDKLYMGEPEDFIKILKKQGKEFNTVMIIAHNPGLETYLQIVDGEIEGNPTGEVAGILLGYFDGQCSTSVEGCEDVVNMQGDCVLNDPEVDPRPWITATEVRCNEMFQTVIQPDVDIDGDGERDLLSLGIRVGAVRAVINEP